MRTSEGCRQRRVLGVWFAGLALAIGHLMAMPSPANAQCAMCRQALGSPEGRQMVAALRNGVHVLLVAPFALVGTIAVLATRVLRGPGSTP